MLIFYHAPPRMKLVVVIVSRKKPHGIEEKHFKIQSCDNQSDNLFDVELTLSRNSHQLVFSTYLPPVRRCASF